MLVWKESRVILKSLIWGNEPATRPPLQGEMLISGCFLRDQSWSLVRKVGHSITIYKPNSLNITFLNPSRNFIKK